MKTLKYITQLTAITACFLLLESPVFAQQTTTDVVEKTTASGPLIYKDVAYGPDPLQGMDVYLVPNRTAKTPLVILVHGGGWMAGDKKDADFMKDFMLSKGMNVVNINYRLGNQTDIHYQEMMKDMGKAIQYITGHAAQWKIRKNNYVFWGGSAGGHLALLYAYKYDPANLISAVISLGGPTKLDDEVLSRQAKKEDLEGLLPIVTGAKWAPGHLDPAYQAASSFYSKKMVPSMLVHGEKDTIVPSHQSTVLAEELTRRHIDHALIILPNGAHGGEGTPEADSIQLQKRMVNWILKYSK